MAGTETSTKKRPVEPRSGLGGLCCGGDCLIYLVYLDQSGSNSRVSSGDPSCCEH